MSQITVKALTNIVRDGKSIKIGETFQIEESEVERLVRHEAIEIIEGPVESKNQIITNPLDDTNLENGIQDGNRTPLDDSNKDGNIEDGSDEGEITLEEIQGMTITEIKKLAEDNNIELKGKLKDELAQELFDKLGEE